MSWQIDLALFACGWSLGWLLLWRLRPLPPAGSTPASARRPMAVVVPARNERRALPLLLPPLVEQLRADDELVVVDDHSDDDTATVATAAGARVVRPPALPDGWLGKPHACASGATATTAPVLVFLDADVRPAHDLLDRLAVAVDGDRGAVVSVQPWHQMGSAGEQASVVANVAALMGCGGFTPLGPRAAATVAFGPVIAVDRATYEAAGGHGNLAVRGQHTEDIALARAVGRSSLFTGRPDTRFRMYPGGLGDTIRGWSRSLATGAGATRWWLLLATLAWVASLVGGWLAIPLVYPLSALQLWVLGRRAGSIHPLTAVLFPLAVLAFVLIFIRSAWLVITRRTVTWKGRQVDAKPSELAD
ncbi:MAG: glycosyltransferase family 2 protein [Actinomycetota bacterium]